MSLTTTWKSARGQGKKVVSRLARRVLPRATLSLTHVEPDLRLSVNLRRHVMFWSGGLERFEPFTVATLRALVRPGDTVFDIGANIGFFSTLLSRLVGPTGIVVAFEPEPENLSLLRVNIDINRCDNVKIVASAVGTEPGRSTFSLDLATGSTGHLGGSATVGEIAVGTGKVSLIETQVESIDALMIRDGVVPDVIKMDIEGGEIQALEGARRTIERHRPFVISELSGDAGVSVVRFLENRRYLLWDLESGHAVISEHRPFMIVAIPSERLNGERANRLLKSLEFAAN